MASQADTSLAAQLCIVPQCDSSYLETPDVQLFKFPSDDTMRLVWLSTIGLKPIVFHQYIAPRVCAHHFDPKYFGKKNKLRQIAIPTLNLPDVKDRFNISNVKQSPSPVKEKAAAKPPAKPAAKPRQPVYKEEVEEEDDDDDEDDEEDEEDEDEAEEPQEEVKEEPVAEVVADNAEDTKPAVGGYANKEFIELVMACTAGETDLEPEPEPQQQILQVGDVHMVYDTISQDDVGREYTIVTNQPEYAPIEEVYHLSEEQIIEEYEEFLTEEQIEELVEIEPVDGEIEQMDECMEGVEEYHLQDESQDVSMLEEHEVEDDGVDDLTYERKVPKTPRVPGKPLPSGQLCIVPFCKTSYRDDPNARMFKFPASGRDRKVWIAAIGLSENVLKSLSVPRICIKHFDPKQVGKKRLKRDAVPTMNLTPKRTRDPKPIRPLSDAEIANHLEVKEEEEEGDEEGEGGEAAAEEEDEVTCSSIMDLEKLDQDLKAIAAKKPFKTARHAVCTNPECKEKNQTQRSVYADQYDKLMQQWQQTKLNHIQLYRRMRLLNISIGKQRDIRNRFFVESRNRKMNVVLRQINMSEPARSLCSILLKKDMNWHEDEKELALSLHSSSPALYYHLRDKLGMNLPSKSSLMRWNQFGVDM